MTMLEIPAIWQPAAQQQIYRKLLDVMARPGMIADLTTELEGTPAWLGALAALLDNTQTLADLSGRLSTRDREFLEARDAPPNDANFILADGATPPPATLTPSPGKLEAPENGATLVVIVSDLNGGPALAELTGPGIADTRTLACTGLARDWLTARARWTRAFPLGVELILADTACILCIPRSTRITINGG